MSWNEPGGDKKDPWSGRDEQKNPPDLDEVIRSLQDKLSRIFGGGGNGGNRDAEASLKNLGFLAAGVVVLWGLSGFYIVDEGNRGVETRFGRYTLTTDPGLNWHLPSPIEQVEVVNISQQRFLEVGYRSAGNGQATGSVPKEALMLTKDENIVDVRLAVQYQVKDAREFLFNIYNPAGTLSQVTESVERGVIGHSTMDFVLTEGRTEVVAEIKKEIQNIMDAYQSGILITSVNLQDAQPPEQVQGAFEDAIKAREDKQRLINEAEGYSNDVIPKARGAAARKTQEGEGYKSRVISAAEGEVSRFAQLLGEYTKAPEVTRQRLYIEAMEQVLGKTNTVMVDVKGGNNMMVLPIDKILQQSSGEPSAEPIAATSSKVQSRATVTTSASNDDDERSMVRGREARGR